MSAGFHIWINPYFDKDIFLKIKASQILEYRQWFTNSLAKQLIILLFSILVQHKRKNSEGSLKKHFFAEYTHIFITCIIIIILASEGLYIMYLSCVKQG